MVRQNKSQFRLFDDADSENWNGFMMNAAKITIVGDSFSSENNGVVFTLKRDLLKTSTEYQFSTTKSRDAKTIVIFLDVMKFAPPTKSKSARDETVIKNYYKKKVSFASGLVFLPLIAYEFYDRISIIK